VEVSYPSAGFEPCLFPSLDSQQLAPSAVLKWNSSSVREYGVQDGEDVGDPGGLKQILDSSELCLAGDEKKLVIGLTLCQPTIDISSAVLLLTSCIQIEGEQYTESCTTRASRPSY
jgi:hypothetical protein